MISAKYIDESHVAYSYTASKGRTGVNSPGDARFQDIEEERIKAGITPDAYIGPTALALWKESMSLSDQTMMPRRFEDHIREDHGGITGDAVLQKKYNDKKELRKSKP